MAGLDAFYNNDVDYNEQGSYSSLSTPGGRSSLHQRRVIEPFHSSSHVLTGDLDNPANEISAQSSSVLQKVTFQILKATYVVELKNVISMCSVLPQIYFQSIL